MKYFRILFEKYLSAETVYSKYFKSFLYDHGNVHAPLEHHSHEKGSYDNYKYFELSRPVRKS